MRIIAHLNGSGQKEFELVELTKEDLRGIRNNLRGRNLRLFKRCLQDACAVIEEQVAEASHGARVAAAVAMFNKLATREITEEQRLLTKKTHFMKEHHKAFSFEPEPEELRHFGQQASATAGH